jgi:hypothetical protein
MLKIHSFFISGHCPTLAYSHDEAAELVAVA